MALPIQKYSYDNLRSRADAFLRDHNPDGAVPVPIEQIIEFRFGINIIPVPGLRQAHEVDAFLSRDFRSLMMDLHVLESRSPNRYRFSLAHELAHAVLHKEVYTHFRFSNIEEWKREIGAISEADLGWLEWQAYSFAGLILVPVRPLTEKLQDGLRLAEETGFSLRDEPDLAKGYLCDWLGRQFEVSSQVAEKRLDKDGLWPPR